MNLPVRNRGSFPAPDRCFRPGLPVSSAGVALLDPLAGFRKVVTNPCMYW